MNIKIFLVKWRFIFMYHFSPLVNFIYRFGIRIICPFLILILYCFLIKPIDGAFEFILRMPLEIVVDLFLLPTFYELFDLFASLPMSCEPLRKLILFLQIPGYDSLGWGFYEGEAKLYSRMGGKTFVASYFDVNSSGIDRWAWGHNTFFRYRLDLDVNRWAGLADLGELIWEKADPTLKVRLKRIFTYKSIATIVHICLKIAVEWFLPGLVALYFYFGDFCFSLFAFSLTDLIVFGSEWIITYFIWLDNIFTSWIVTIASYLLNQNYINFDLTNRLFFFENLKIFEYEGNTIFVYLFVLLKDSLFTSANMYSLFSVISSGLYVLQMALVYASSDISLEPYVHTCLQIFGIGLFYLYNIIESSFLFFIYCVVDAGVYCGLFPQDDSEDFLSSLMALFYLGLELLDFIMNYLFFSLHNYIYVFNSFSIDLSRFDISRLNVEVERDVWLLMEFYIGLVFIFLLDTDFRSRLLLQAKFTGVFPVPRTMEELEVIGALNPMLLEEMCEKNPGLRHILDVWCGRISLDSEDLSTGDYDYLVTTAEEDFDVFVAETSSNRLDNLDEDRDAIISFIGRSKKLSQKDKDFYSLKATRYPTPKQVGGFSRTEDVEFFGNLLLQKSTYREEDILLIYFILLLPLIVFLGTFGSGLKLIMLKSYFRYHGNEAAEVLMGFRLARMFFGFGLNPMVAFKLGEHNFGGRVGFGHFWPESWGSHRFTGFINRYDDILDAIKMLTPRFGNSDYDNRGYLNWSRDGRGRISIIYMYKNSNELHSLRPPNFFYRSRNYKEYLIYMRYTDKRRFVADFYHIETNKVRKIKGHVFHKLYDEHDNMLNTLLLPFEVQKDFSMWRKYLRVMGRLVCTRSVQGKNLVGGRSEEGIAEAYNLSQKHLSQKLTKSSDKGYTTKYGLNFDRFSGSKANNYRASWVGDMNPANTGGNYISSLYGKRIFYLEWLIDYRKALYSKRLIRKDIDNHTFDIWSYCLTGSSNLGIRWKGPSFSVPRSTRKHLFWYGKALRDSDSTYYFSGTDILSQVPRVTQYLQVGKQGDYEYKMLDYITKFHETLRPYNNISCYNVVPGKYFMHGSRDRPKMITAGSGEAFVAMITDSTYYVDLRGGWTHYGKRRGKSGILVGGPSTKSTSLYQWFGKGMLENQEVLRQSRHLRGTVGNRGNSIFYSHLFLGHAKERGLRQYEMDKASLYKEAIKLSYEIGDYNEEVKSSILEGESLQKGERKPKGKKVKFPKRHKSIVIGSAWRPGLDKDFRGASIGGEGSFIKNVGVQGIKGEIGRSRTVLDTVHVLPEALEKKDWPILNIDDIFGFIKEDWFFEYTSFPSGWQTNTFFGLYRECRGLISDIYDQILNYKSPITRNTDWRKIFIDYNGVFNYKWIVPEDPNKIKLLRNAEHGWCLIFRYIEDKWQVFLDREALYSDVSSRWKKFLDPAELAFTSNNVEEDFLRNFSLVEDNFVSTCLPDDDGRQWTGGHSAVDICREPLSKKRKFALSGVNSFLDSFHVSYYLDYIKLTEFTRDTDYEPYGRYFFRIFDNFLRSSNLKYFPLMSEGSSFFEKVSFMVDDLKGVDINNIKNVNIGSNIANGKEGFVVPLEFYRYFPWVSIPERDLSRGGLNQIYVGSQFVDTGERRKLPVGMMKKHLLIDYYYVESRSKLTYVPYKFFAGKSLFRPEKIPLNVGTRGSFVFSRGGVTWETANDVFFEKISQSYCDYYSHSYLGRMSIVAVDLIFPALYNILYSILLNEAIRFPKEGDDFFFAKQEPLDLMDDIKLSLSKIANNLFFMKDIEDLLRRFTKLLIIVNDLCKEEYSSDLLVYMEDGAGMELEPVTRDIMGDIKDFLSLVADKASFIGFMENISNTGNIVVNIVRNFMGSIMNNIEDIEDKIKNNFKDWNMMEDIKDSLSRITNKGTKNDLLAIRSYPLGARWLDYSGVPSNYGVDLYLSDDVLGRFGGREYNSNFDFLFNLNNYRNDFKIFMVSSPLYKESIFSKELKQRSDDLSFLRQLERNSSSYIGVALKNGGICRDDLGWFGRFKYDLRQACYVVNRYFDMLRQLREYEDFCREVWIKSNKKGV